VLCWTQLYQVSVAARSCWFSEDISEELSEWSVTTLTATLATPNSRTSPTMSLPLMVRSENKAASRASPRAGEADGPDISQRASARTRRRGPCG
jgi:hypothetical protein